MTAEIFEGVDLFELFVAKGDGWLRLGVEAVHGEDLGLPLADVEMPGLGHPVEVGDNYTYKSIEAVGRVTDNSHVISVEAVGRGQEARWDGGVGCGELHWQCNG